MDNAINNKRNSSLYIVNSIFSNLNDEDRNHNINLIFQIFNSIVDKADIDFSMELALQMYNYYDNVDNDTYEELVKKIITKYISLNGEISLFNIESPKIKVFILKYWNFAMQESFLDSKSKVIDDDKLDILGLISSFMREGEKGYLKLIELFDKDKLKDKLDKKISLVDKYDKQYIKFFNDFYLNDKVESEE